MDTEFWRQLKTPCEPIQAPAKKKKERKTFRDLVFRLLMPGIFVFTVFYYAFVFTPECAGYYVQLCCR